MAENLTEVSNLTQGQGKIVAEDNSRRKFHRVSLKLKLEYNGHLYSVRDWSVGGVAIESFDPGLSIGDVVNIRVVLPMPDSQLFVQMPVRVCNNRGSVTGCEFHNLNPRQKRILRHYVEMALEGQLQSVDDMIAITTAPVIASPIDEALTFTELEKNAIEKNFRRKSYVTIAMAVVIAAVFLLSILYVTIFRIERVGVAVGSLESITSTGEGVVKRAYNLEVGTFVRVGDPLFELDSSGLRAQLAEIESELAQFESQVIGDKNLVAQSGRLLAEMKRRVNRRAVEYEHAKQLYGSKLISLTDITRLEDKLLEARESYQIERARVLSQQTPTVNAVALSKERTRLFETKQSISEQLDARTVRANVSGKIVSINFDEGMYIEPQDVVAVIDKNVEPVVSMRLLSEDALRLTVGTPVRIYAPVLGDYFDAHVTDIGYAAFKLDSTVTDEVKQGETLVRIAFDDKRIRLPPNSRVKVWIQTFKWPWE